MKEKSGALATTTSRLRFRAARSRSPATITADCSGWSSCPSPQRSRRVVDAGSRLVLPFFTLASRRIFAAHARHTRRLWVEDLDVVERTVRLAGYETTRADNEIQGVRRFHSFDPFGNRLEFQQD